MFLIWSWSFLTDNLCLLRNSCWKFSGQTLSWLLHESKWHQKEFFIHFSLGQVPQLSLGNLIISFSTLSFYRCHRICCFSGFLACSTTFRLWFNHLHKIKIYTPIFIALYWDSLTKSCPLYAANACLLTSRAATCCDSLSSKLWWQR